MDLSGTMQGAGGVAGLLSVNDGSANYYPIYDGNGNVSEYVDATGSVVAHYEYDAFGQAVASGAKSGEFTHQFSTRQFDAEGKRIVSGQYATLALDFTIATSIS